jgi:DNA-binding NarL/FixJ family response regulator
MSAAFQRAADPTSGRSGVRWCGFPPLRVGCSPLVDRTRTATINPVHPTTLLVDDHQSFRAGARRLLEAGGLEIVGEAADAAGAIAQVERLHPELVLLDIDLGADSGFDVARRLAEVDGGPAVILISSHEYSDFGGEIAACGAMGFVAKDELSVATVQKVMR